MVQKYMHIYIYKGQLEGLRVYSPLHYLFLVITHSIRVSIKLKSGGFFFVHFAYFTLTDKIKTIYSKQSKIYMYIDISFLKKIYLIVRLIVIFILNSCNSLAPTLIWVF